MGRRRAREEGEGRKQKVVYTEKEELITCLNADYVPDRLLRAICVLLFHFAFTVIS